MKVAGNYTLNAPREDVYKALQDPGVLSRTLPGVQQLEVTGPDEYSITLNAGVASIKGTYQGQLVVTDKQEPERYTMKASGSGGPGTISADAVVSLHEVEDGTRLEYDADAIVGGMIAGVGQRVIQGVAKRTAGEFFGAIEQDLTAGPPAPAVPTEAAAPGERPAAAGVPAQTGQVFRAPEPAAAPAADATKLLAAAALGAVVALAGVLVGRRLAA